MFFSFAMQRFSIELWNVIACIAAREGVAMELQLLRPYGAGSVVRCSLFVNAILCNTVLHCVTL